MSDRRLIDLFVEDRAHEELLKPLVARVAQEEGVEIRIRVRTARGGHPRALSEFKLFQRLRSRTRPISNLVVVAIDGNCSTFSDARDSFRRAATAAFHERLVVGCPDPHVELWYLADPQSFEAVVGDRPRVGRRKCERDHYKRVLDEAIHRGGHPPTLGGVEFASELIEAMDLYRAGKTAPSLKAFLDDLRAGLRRVLRPPAPSADLLLPMHGMSHR